MPEFIIPRDEKILTEFFEDLLLMKTEKFSAFERDEGDEKFKLNKNDLSLLHKTGIINKIFRRWFQTTWGENNWSVFFDGETPRQELSHCYSDFEAGEAMLSVGMENRGGEWRINPRLSLKSDILENGGVFTWGLNNLEAQTQNAPKFFAPVFDPSFEYFAEYMAKVKQTAKGLNSYRPPETEEGEWWMLFWSQIGISIAAGILLELPQKQIFKTALELQEYLTGIVLKFAEDKNFFIEIDRLFAFLWDILKNNDKRLAPYDEMINKSGDNKFLRSKLNNPNYLYSVKVFYNLGHIFDEKILFPADRYFGAAECVWTDRENFFGTLAHMIMLLKNGLDAPGANQKLSREEKETADYINISETAFNINRMWFAPPTAFRLLPSVERYM